MRLIDADALKELFSEVIGHIAQKPEMNGNLEHMIRASAMVIQMIDDAPTIEAPDINVGNMDIIRCKDCEWWTKQKDSIQGRCALHKMYPSGNWYCGTARRRGEQDG